MKLKIRRFIRLHKHLALYGAVFIVTLIALIVGLIPAISKSVKLVSDLRTMQDDINRIQTKVSMLQNLNQQELEKYASDMLAAVPADRSLTTLLSTIDSLAVKHNLFISDMSIEGVTSLASRSGAVAIKAEGNSLIETISLQGELLNLRNFLSDCIRVRRLMRVKDLVLTSMPKSNLITAKLTVEVFYLPFPQTIGKISDVIEPFSQKEMTTLATIQSFPMLFSMGSGASVQSITPVKTILPTAPSVVDPFAPIRPRAIISPTPMTTLLPSVSPIRLSPTSTPRATSSASPEGLR